MIETLNSFGAAWWSWMAPMFWQVALLTAIVWCIDLVLRRRGWPQVRYALWLLVMVRLFIPPTFSLPSSVTAHLIPATAPTAPTMVQEALPSAVGPQVGAPAVFSPAATAPPALPTAPAPTAHLAEASAQARPALSLKAWAMLLSSAVSLLLLGWLAATAVRLRRMAREAASPEESIPWIGDVVAECARKLRLHRVPRLALTDGIKSAAVYGVFRPVLLLPKRTCAEVPREQMEHILLHELAHIKRGDLVVNAAQTIAHILYWFHPFVWLAGRHLRHLRELCCDATVSTVLRERTGEYRDTLMDAARSMVFGKTGAGLGLLGLFESASRLRQRLEHLKRPVWKHARLRALVAVAAAAVMLACIVPMARGRTTDAPRTGKEVTASRVGPLGDAPATQVLKRLEDVLKDDVELKDVTFKMKYILDTDARIDTLCEVSMLDSSHCRFRTSASGTVVLKGDNGQGQQISTKEEHLTVADGQYLWLEFARLKQTGDVEYQSVRKPIEEAPKLTFPAQMHIPGVKSLCKLFDVEFRRGGPYEGRDALYFAGKARNFDEMERLSKRERNYFKQYYKEVEIVVDVATGLPLYFMIRGGPEGQLRPTEVQQISEIKWNAGLKKSDFRYDEKRITEKALKEAIAAEIPTTNAEAQPAGAAKEAVVQPPAGNIPAEVREHLRGRVSISFDKTPLPRLVPFLQAITPLDYVLISEDVPPDGAPITISVESTLGHCLNLICELADMSWTVEGNVVKIGKAESLKGRAMRAPVPPVPPQMREHLTKRVSLPFHDTPMGQVVLVLRQVTRAQLVLFQQDLPDDGAPITLHFGGKLVEALNDICDQAGLAWVVEGPVIKIGKPERFETVRALLASGVDVNALDENQQTPLHHAALAGHKEVAELLLNHGADANAAASDDALPKGRAQVDKRSALLTTKEISWRLIDGRIHKSQRHSGEWIGIGHGLQWWYTHGTQLAFETDGPKVFLKLDDGPRELVGIRLRSASDLSSLGEALAGPQRPLAVWLEGRLLGQVSKLRNIERISSLNVAPSADPSDLSVVKQLGGLRRLYLHGCEKVHDVRPLAALGSLESLAIRQCPHVADLSPLAKLSRLAHLSILYCAEVSDLSPIGQLENLVELSVWDCPKVEDLSAVSNLGELRILMLSGLKNVPQLPPLGKLANLEYCFFAGNHRISDLSELSRPVNLRTLTLRDCDGITDISPLGKLTNLTGLGITDCDAVSDLSPLSNLSALTSLSLSGCRQVSDLSPLSELEDLARLDIASCPAISDLSPLANLDKLNFIYMRKCPNISDFTPLREMIRRRGTILLDADIRTAYEKARAQVAEEARAAISETGKPVVAPPTQPLEPTEKPGDLRGRVLLPDGRPVAGAEVVLCIARSTVQIQHGGEQIFSNATKTTQTDQKGRFSFDRPTAEDFDWPERQMAANRGVKYMVVVAHEYGYAEATPAELRTGADITLQPCGTVEGKLVIGTEPGAHLPVDLQSEGRMDRAHRDAPRISRDYATETNADGGFFFGSVPPGQWRVLRRIKVWEDGRGGSRWTSTQVKSVEVEPGKTLRVDLGGVGRPVVGRIDVSAALRNTVDWNTLTVHLRPRRDETGEGDPQAVRCSAKVNDDGSFFVPDVPAGAYELDIYLHERSPRGLGRSIGRVHREFVVGEMPGGRSEEPFDLGVLEPELKEGLMVGQTAPLFEVDTFEGKPLRLKEFRGGFVLLHFWASDKPARGFDETPFLKMVYDAHGEDDRCVMIGLSLDTNAEVAKKHAADKGFKWPQGIVSEGFTASLLKQYGIRRIPQIILIGPDRRIVARNLVNGLMPAVVQEALSKQ